MEFIKFKPVLFALGFILMGVNTTAFASLVTYKGYTLNTDTNIVSDDSLDWLQWDETLGLSIEHSLATNSGWRLATTGEMSSLFDTFFPVNNWSIDENIASSYQPEFTNNDYLFANFSLLFGSTAQSYDSTTTTYLNHFTVTSALFGDDLDTDGYFQKALAFDSSQYIRSGETYNVLGLASLSEDEYNIQYNNVATGVALVRDRSLTSVPEPSALLLVMLGLVCIPLSRHTSKTKN